MARASENTCAVQAAALGDAVLRCLECPLRNVAETAVEYFETLSTVPVAERSPAFRAPMFGRLLPPLLRHARYPQSFTSWEECIDDDCDEFHRFRWEPAAVAQYNPFIGSVCSFLVLQVCA